MKKIKIDIYSILEKIHDEKPVIHHLTNWVTIYDCANAVKVLGASPVMAHAPQEVADMTGIASALVLNIGTLTSDFIESMKIAALQANKKGIPVVLDACGAGATQFRDEKSFELMDTVKINIIKGNMSEIARISGEKVKTKGVDSSKVEKDMVKISKKLAKTRKCVVVVTGKEDIITDGKRVFIVKNGHPMMSEIVGTGCMSTSVVGTFAAVEKDLMVASAAGLVCFEIASQLAADASKGPGSFKEKIYDFLYHLDKKTLDSMQNIETL